MKDNSKRIKSLFITYFDGCYGIEPPLDRPNTYTLGICKLDYDNKKNELTVHLRRPGLLIGEAGKDIDALQSYLECDIKINEINLYELK